MQTPNPKYFCPRCRAAFDVDHNYCGRCGADMHRASRLHRSLQLREDSGRHIDPTRATEPATVLTEARRPRSGSTVPAGPSDGPARGARSGRPTTLGGGPRATSNADLDAPVDEADGEPVRNRRAGDADPWLGRVVDNRYRVTDVIGRGGMGVVYKIEHQRMGKIAAMKVLHGDLAADPEVIARFRREAEAVSRLTHPNTVQVFDFGTAQGALYLVMEYVRGLDVGSLVDRDGPMSFERAGPLVGQICAALTEAHDLGIVHRDLKPENILVTRTHGGHDFVKVLDFGLAKLTEREEVASVTSRGSIVGTPYYMSPEQIRGEDQVDPRSDIYSLGALMYRVLTGEPAFTANSPVGVLTKHLTEEVVPPSRRAPELAIPPEVDSIVLTAMRKDPAQRYPSVREMLEELEQAYAALYDHSASGRRPLGWRGSAGSGAAITPRSMLLIGIDDGIDSERRLRRADLDAYERSLKRRRWVGVVALPLLLVGLGGGGYYYYSWLQRQPHTREQEPNNRVEDATLIASGQPVTGHLGRRLSKTRSDQDFFRLGEVPDPHGGQQLTVQLSGLPNMDLELSLYDPAGQRLTVVNEGGVGQSEWLRHYRVTEPVVLVVGEARAPGSTLLPTENVSDQYQLTVRLSPAAPGQESEPNESSSDAQPLQVGTPVTGWLDRRDDADVFRFDGSAGRYRVAIAGAQAAPLMVRIGDRPASPGRDQTVSLAPGVLISLSRKDQGLAAGAPLPGADQSYVLSVEPAGAAP